MSDPVPPLGCAATVRVWMVRLVMPVIRVGISAVVGMVVVRRLAVVAVAHGGPPMIVPMVVWFVPAGVLVVAARARAVRGAHRCPPVIFGAMVDGQWRRSGTFVTSSPPSVVTPVVNGVRRF
jgi:hypothetical protein